MGLFEQITAVSKPAKTDREMITALMIVIDQLTDNVTKTALVNQRLIDRIEFLEQRITVLENKPQPLL